MLGLTTVESFLENLNAPVQNINSMMLFLLVVSVHSAGTKLGL